MHHRSKTYSTIAEKDESLVRKRTITLCPACDFHLPRTVRRIDNRIVGQGLQFVLGNPETIRRVGSHHLRRFQCRLARYCIGPFELVGTEPVLEILTAPRVPFSKPLGNLFSAQWFQCSVNHRSSKCPVEVKDIFYGVDEEGYCLRKSIFARSYGGKIIGGVKPPSRFSSSTPK
jgi:hypothetical protein